MSIKSINYINQLFLTAKTKRTKLSSFYVETLARGIIMRPSFSPHKIAFFCLALTLGFFAKTTAAGLGEAAPPLIIDQWVKGPEVDMKAGKGKSIYVVLFWESDCLHCIESFPLLSKLQARFRSQGLILIGISPEPAGKIKLLADKMGDKMDFVVAADDRRQTYDNYMTAFHRNIIPCAFVVDKNGIVVWQGHPAAGLEQAINEILTGKFELETAKKVANAENLLQKYFLMVSVTGDVTKAAEMGNQILTDGATNPWLLNNFAWQILTDPNIKTRDRKLALRAAKLACDLSGGENPAFIDTLAKGQFDTGQVQEAIKLQRQALALCKDDKLRVAMEEALRNYETKSKHEGK